MLRIFALAVILAMSAASPPSSPLPPAPTPPQPSVLMNWPDLLDRPRPAPTTRVRWGRQSGQFAELWLPAGKGPFPVVLMVHGGCWRSRIANLSIMNWIAEDLRAKGIAVWNIEYRGVDQAGGGYPGTFLDAGQGANSLRAAAAAWPLKIDKVVAFGHSAGGHLALWLAARRKLPPWSPLRSKDPLPIAAVVSSGGLPDLEADRAAGDTAACGKDTVDLLTGKPGPGRKDVYADTSPARLLPLHVVQLVVNGDKDGVAPPWLGRAWEAKARRAGDRVTMNVVANIGHVELIAPGSAAWEAEKAAILRLLR